ncbi:hypothetical protein [Nocardioides zeae]
MAGDADAAREWREAYERVSGLVATTQLRDPGALEHAVPATPDWRARDLVAHMIGVGSDTLGDAVDEEHGEDWTQRHVDARRDHAVPQLLEEWSDLAGRIEEHVATTDPGPLGDIVIHEQDLRGALGTPAAARRRAWRWCASRWPPRSPTAWRGAARCAWRRPTRTGRGSPPTAIPPSCCARRATTSPAR